MEDTALQPTPPPLHTDDKPFAESSPLIEPAPLESVSAEVQAQASQDMQEEENTGGDQDLITRVEERPRTTSYSYDNNALRQRMNAVVERVAEPEQMSSSRAKTGETGPGERNSEYECNICFDTATNPVITLCGHLFCWPCLHQWLDAQSRNPLCPVCKAGCEKEKVIPIYGRGKDSKDPRSENIPNRPPGQRPTPRRDPNQPASPFFDTTFSGININPHFTVAAGFGLFPSMFSVQFAWPPSQGNIHPGQQPQREFFTRLMLMLLVLILMTVVFY
ncbi:uncharacterized protein VTP21DRAFT_6624 [Calcarisporiella thermophila]|uniref:uncharacterized protein n=1 Tax=Calcarisporiella thermophila TaxID=911321 RepID=UPI00374366FA